MTRDEFDEFLPDAQTTALVLDQKAADRRINEIRDDEVLATMVATLKKPDPPRDAEPSERVETIDPKTVPPNNAPRITLSTVKVAPSLAPNIHPIMLPKIAPPIGATPLTDVASPARKRRVKAQMIHPARSKRRSL